jgi:hypothetical protein
VAGRARLSAGSGLRLAALLVLVLLLHIVALQWLARQLEPASVLRPLPTPMFTRLLQQEAPIAVPVQPSPPAVRARPKRSAITSLPTSKPRAPRAVASGPTPAAPESPSIASGPKETQVAASTPEVTATTSTASTIATTSTSSTTATTATASTLTTSTTASPAPASAASAASAATAANAGVDSWPADTRLNYRLGGYFRGDLHGSAKVQWQRQDDRYQTRVEIDLTLLASLVLTSQGDVTAQGLLPRAYEESRRSGPRVVRLGTDSITLNDGRSVPRPPGVQDTASQFVELAHRFASGQEVLEVGRSVSFWMARPGAVDLWTYDIVGREILQTPELGAIEAFHLKPRPIANPRGNITAEMWFAPSLRYLPVRIRVNMGEATFVDLLVEKIEQR